MKKLILLLSLMISVEVAFPTPSQPSSQEDWHDIVTEKVDVEDTVDDKSIQDKSVQEKVDVEVSETILKKSKLKNPKSKKLTISFYTGTEGIILLPDHVHIEEYVGGTNLGGQIGLGTEWMYKNVSINLGAGYTPKLIGANTRRYWVGFYNYYHQYEYACFDHWDCIDNIIGRVIGFKVYNSDDDSNNRVFAGLNLINTSFNCYNKIERYENTKPRVYEIIRYDISTKVNTKRVAFIAGSRHTFCNGMYLSQYAGITNRLLPCFGVNVGYYFHPIKCRSTKNSTR